MQPSGTFGNRPPTSGTQYGYNRPPSATGGAGFGAPGTASRRQQSPWTGTQGQPAAGMGVSLQTSVEVAARPVMREGMKGMHMPAQQTGSRRQVMDRSYHLGQLRSKNAELSAELERLREEERRLQQSAGQMSAISTKMKELESEVQRLKGELSDLNFAVEKSAGGVDVSRITEEAADLRELNKQEKQQIDLKFMERAKCEDKYKVVALKVEELTTKLEHKLQDEPHRRQAYYRVREQSAQLAADVYIKEKELKALNAKYQQLHMQMKADPQKMLQYQQREQVNRMRAEAESLRNEFTGDLVEEKKQLLAQVKADVTAIDTIQSGIREARAELEEARGKLKSLENDLHEITGDRHGKYKQLEQRDQEMQEYIENFDGERTKQLNLNRDTGTNIVNLLEHISDKLKNQNRAGASADEIGPMQRAVDESTTTAARLQSELELRKNELKKVNNLDGKITAELEAINKKIQEHEAAMTKFSDIEGLHQEHEERKKKLSSDRVLLSQVRVHLKKQVQQLNHDYETRRDELQANEVHQPLQLQEQKVRQIRQTLYQLNDFVKQKTAETAYLPLKADCMRMAEETNTFLKDPKRLEKVISRGRAF